MASPKDGARGPQVPAAVAPPAVERGGGDPPLGSNRPHALPTSRISRLARLGALAPRAIPMATEVMRRAIGVSRSDEDEREARARVLASAKKTAEAMLKTLGEMKGLPLKFGQMASYIDGLAPPGYEEKFQSV